MIDAMKKLAVALVFSAAGAAAQAMPIITFDSAAAGDGSGLTTSVSGATVIDFNSGSKPAIYSGDGGVVTGSVSGQYAAPAGDSTPYLTVALQSSAGVELVLPGGSYNYFGLYWGSMDNYNTLSFYNGSDLVSAVTGADVIAAGTALGDQTAPGSNRYVNFFFGGDFYDRILLETTQFAFESDNHAFARVPEPGTLALLGVGLVAVGLARRRKA